MIANELQKNWFNLILLDYLSKRAKLQMAKGNDSQ